MPTMCCDLITATSKTGKTQRMASSFVPSDAKHVKAWKRWYGETVLDFGAGLLDKSLVMRDTMGVDCVAFEREDRPESMAAVLDHLRQAAAETAAQRTRA